MSTSNGSSNKYIDRIRQKKPNFSQARFTDARLHFLLFSYLPKWIVQDKALKQDDKLVVMSMPNSHLCHSNLAILQLKRAGNYSRELQE